MNLNPFFLNIDWTELRNQKTALIGAIEYFTGNKQSTIPDKLLGILHLIDAIQDYAVDEMNVPENLVYDFELEEMREKENY